MNAYKTILVAIDLTQESDQIIQRAFSLATSNDCAIHLLHVIEPLGYFYSGDGVFPYGYVELEAERLKLAQSQIEKFATNYQISKSRLHFESGNAASIIHDVAKKIKADLILVGSHGRHGIALLLGSTANSVLHGSQCDVLAVRVSKNE